MSRRQDLHTHTTCDDGAASSLDMARSAAAAGLTSLGFSVHSPPPWDNDWAVTADRLPAYRAEIAALREAFRGTLDIYGGIEWDSQSRNVYGSSSGALHCRSLTNCWAVRPERLPRRTCQAAAAARSASSVMLPCTPARWARVRTMV